MKSFLSMWSDSELRSVTVNAVDRSGQATP